MNRYVLYMGLFFIIGLASALRSINLYHSYGLDVGQALTLVLLLCLLFASALLTGVAIMKYSKP